MAKARDSQRSKVYAWERAHVPDFDGKQSYKLTLRQCEIMINRVWADYRPTETPPRVADGRGCSNAKGGRWRITLPRWARTVPIVLHELAHPLTRSDLPAHGPEFVRLFIDLLVRYNEGDKAELLRTARAARVKVGQAQAVAQPKARRSSRPVYERRPCRPHNWIQGQLQGRVLTRQGFVLYYEAVCSGCAKVRSVTPDALAALRPIGRKVQP